MECACLHDAAAVRAGRRDAVDDGSNTVSSQCDVTTVISNCRLVGIQHRGEGNRVSKCTKKAGSSDQRQRVAEIEKGRNGAP